MALNQDFTMEVEELPIKKGERLIKALKDKGYKNIPENVVLSKTLTGIGATYCEIKANRNSIIIEPNVPVILGKLKKHTGLLGVYDNCTKTQIKKYFIAENIRNKKFLTTPEGFTKIRKVAESLNIDIYEDYFCLFDECEKITQDTGFRKNISNPVYDFFKFKAKAFVSATPLKINHPKIAKQGFRLLKVIPDYNYSQDIRLIVTNNFNKEFERRIKEYEESECVCIFYNTTQGINRILSNTILSDYRVFCSDKSANQLKDRKFENISSEFDNKLAKYNFFTSRFFSAVDMELDVAPDIILLTDLYEAEHSTIDPFTEAIQIQGRFREEINGIRYKSITHITNIKPYLLAREKDAILSELDEYQINHDALTKQLMNTSDVDRRRAIEKMIKNQPYNRLLDKRGVINDFAVDNWINEERVNRYFTNKDDFLQAYWDSNFFNPVISESIFSLETSTSYSIRKSRSAKETIQTIVELLHKLPDSKAIEDFRMLLREDTRYMKESVKKQFDSDVIIDVYLEMGDRVFEKNGFNFKKIKIEFETFKGEKAIKEKRFSPDVVLDILDSFNVSDRIAKNTVKEIISNIYAKHGITHKVTHFTIGEYFKVTPQNNDKPKPTFIFKNILPEFLSLRS